MILYENINEVQKLQFSIFPTYINYKVAENFLTSSLNFIAHFNITLHIMSYRHFKFVCKCRVRCYGIHHKLKKILLHGTGITFADVNRMKIMVKQNIDFYPSEKNSVVISTVVCCKERVI